MNITAELNETFGADMNYIILVTGLGSSIPFIGRIWTKWARKLEKAVTEQISGDSVRIIHVSSDGAGEMKALNEVRAAIEDGSITSLQICGHSNGFRDGLNIAESVAPFPVNYFAGIDMTLGEFGAKATNNIQHFDEFHARLEQANFANDFLMSKHNYHKIDKGHTAAASDKFVQTKICNTLVENILQQ